MSQGMLACASVTVWTGFSTRSTRTIGHPDGQSPLHVRAEPARADTPVHAAGSGSAAAHWLVTEYGARNLRGMTLRERARALIEIAHPDFREELTDAARERHLLA